MSEEIFTEADQDIVHRSGRVNGISVAKANAKLKELGIAEKLARLALDDVDIELFNLDITNLRAQRDEARSKLAAFEKLIADAGILAV